MWMLMRKPVLVALMLSLGAITVATTQSGKPWPPAVQSVTERSEPRSPQEEMNTFFMAPGYRVELVAGEPMVQDPVAIDWDLEGRLWIVEMPGYMPDRKSTRLNSRHLVSSYAVLSL